MTQILSQKQSTEELTKPKKFLFIINPASGRSRALQIWEQKVKPILVETRTNFELFITEHANHASEKMQDIDTSQYQAITVVSGDGLLFEVVNGLTKRSDSADRLPLPLGVIPGGSGNGLAQTVNQQYLHGTKSNDPLFDSIMHVIHGHPVPMDLIKVTTKKRVIYSFLSTGWGLMSDIDIESERLRMLGEPRFTVWSLVRTLALRKYHGRLSYLPANETYAISPLSAPVPQNWVTVEDHFVQVYSAYQSHISTSIMFAPESKFDDGIIWLIYLLGNVTRNQVLRFLLALEKGKHVKLPFVTIVPVKAFRLEPTDNQGKLTVDGELIECGPAQAEVVPKMAQILTR